MLVNLARKSHRLALGHTGATSGDLHHQGLKLTYDSDAEVIDIEARSDAGCARRPFRIGLDLDHQLLARVGHRQKPADSPNNASANAYHHARKVS
jgi:hypothetical protein